MKRGIVWLILIALVCTGALAGAESLRHEVTGDVSEFIVGGELDQAEENAEGSEASLGTDAYLIVDSESASRVTFYAADENGNPIAGALIYITYNGITELYGVTGADGRVSFDLFRDVEYGYLVSRNGYESASGTFTATQQTRLVRVVLRKLYELRVQVVDGDTKLGGVTVILDGETQVTDANGYAAVCRPAGKYDITVVTPEGRRVIVRAVVREDTVIVVDIGADQAIARDGIYRDRFLVYNQFYDPEDYVLTYYDFQPEDLVRGAEESEAEFQQRIARYLGANLSTVLVEAQPERIQYEGQPDEDVLNEYGQRLYTQRSLMPSGYVLRAWEEKGYGRLAFTNEDAGMVVMTDALHQGDMMKVWAILYALTNQEVTMADIATAETLEKPDGLEASGLAALEDGVDELHISEIDLEQVRAFEFDFDHEAGDPGHANCELLPEALFTNTTFEFRITPIQPESVLNMVTDGLEGEPAMDSYQIMLARPEYFRELIRQWQAEGRLTNTECKELFEFVVDGRLDAGEIESLRSLLKAGELASEDVRETLRGALCGKIYRMQVFINCDGIRSNVTSLVNPTIVWDVEASFEEEYAHQYTLSQENEEEVGEEELIRRTEDALTSEREYLHVNNEGRKGYVEDYQPGENMWRLPVTLQNVGVDSEDEFAGTLLEKEFGQLIVDVRLETPEAAGQQDVYHAYIAEESAQLSEGWDYRFEVESPASGLYTVAWSEQLPAAERPDAGAAAQGD